MSNPIPLQVVIPPDLLAALIRDQLPGLIREAIRDQLPDLIKQAAPATDTDLSARVLEVIENEADAIVSAIEDTRMFHHAVVRVVESCDLDENVEKWVKDNPDTIAEALRDNGDLTGDASNVLEKVAEALQDAANSLT